MHTRALAFCVILASFVIPSIAFAQPNIASLSAASGGAGASITITGTGFATQTGNTVTFLGTPATTITSWTSTTIKAIVPTGAPTGLGSIIVTVGGVQSNAKAFTVTPPHISSLSTSSGAVGASVTITGNGFGASQVTGSSITFSGTAATPTSWSATQIKTTVPSVPAGTANIVVTVAGGAPSNGKSLTVLPTPSITGISPAFGAVGILVTISGANFGASQGTVQFPGAAATLSTWSANQITVKVPTGAGSGNIVVNTSGVSTTGGNFNVLGITSIAVTPSLPSLPLNSVQQYTATALYSDNSTQSLGANAAWTSSAPTVASVGATGVVTALGQGQATIQAAFGSIAATTTVNVGASSFVPVGSLNTARYNHTATLLPNGKVLIVGGQQQSTILASAELYDPTTGAFTPTGSLATARAQHTATLLPNGMVLVVGGYKSGGAGVVTLSSAELYNPSTGTFTSTGNMNNPHDSHTATLLNDGTVLIAGGEYSLANGQNGKASSEIYNPATGTFAFTNGNLSTPRAFHTATLLNDGTVLITGGNDAGFNILASAELYTPATGVFSSIGNLNFSRWVHTATLLNTGKVLIAGGDSTLTSPTSAELYDPVAGAFSVTGGLTVDRFSHAAALLQSGQPLIVGGELSSGVTGSGELFDPSALTFTASGALNRPRFSHTATLLNDGTVLIAGGINIHEEGGAELYVGAGPTYATPSSLRITPLGVNMLVGGTQQFTAVDGTGHPRTDVTWTVDNTSLATISTDTSPILTALAAGQVTVTATVEGASAQTQVTILQGTALPTGTVLWSAGSFGGFSPLQFLQAAPIQGAPSLYSTQVNNNNTGSTIQALTADGQQLWQTSLPAVNATSVPDAFGGLLVTEHQTCNPGQTDAMTIVDLDPSTGEPVWQITAQPTAGASGPLYCFPDAPQFAIRDVDGAVAIVAPGNTSGLPELMIVDGKSGNAISTPTIPVSTYTNPDQSQVLGYSPIGPPLVDSTGSLYVEYEVRTIAYPPQVVSATLYLLQIAPNNSLTTIQLSSSTSDQNLFPGQIIPDGQGGVIATWTINPSNPPVPSNPYQAAHVVAGAVAATYPFPFAPKTLAPGKYPKLVLGENGTAFATDGSDPDNGPQIISFDVSSGSLGWSYQASTQNTLSFITAAAGNGLVAKTTGLVDSVIRFDSTGALTADPLAGIGVDYYVGNLWMAAFQNVVQGNSVDWPNSVFPRFQDNCEAKTVIPIRVHQFSDSTATLSTITNEVFGAIDFWQKKAGILMAWKPQQVVVENPCSNMSNCWQVMPGSVPIFNPDNLSYVEDPDDLTKVPLNNSNANYYWQMATNYKTRFKKTTGIDIFFLNTLQEVPTFHAVATALYDVRPTFDSQSHGFLKTVANQVLYGPNASQVMAHEVGHTLQLFHVQVSDNLMCGEYPFLLLFNGCNDPPSPNLFLWQWVDATVAARKLVDYSPLQ